MKLKSSVAWLEDAIITISGPALAISGIIAGVDLVTGGNILRSMPAFTLAWAITLLLTLDFQVLALGVRAHRVYLSDKGTTQKIVEIALAVFIAAAISIVSIQMQSIIARVNAENITIDIAAAQLGISTLALIWERSTLVLVLIFMSGWLREQDSKEQEKPAQPLVDMALFMAAIDERIVRIEQATNPNMLAIEAPVQPIEGEHAQVAVDALLQEVTGEQTVSYGDAIEALLKEHPGLTVREISERVGCSLSTANKWVQRLKVPGKE